MPTLDSGPRPVASLYHVGTFTLYSLAALSGAFGPTPVTNGLNEDSERKAIRLQTPAQESGNRVLGNGNH